MKTRILSFALLLILAVSLQADQLGPYLWDYNGSPVSAPVTAINPPPGAIVIDKTTGVRYTKISAVGSNDTYVVVPTENVYAHAATATIAVGELYGGTLTNTGASGAVVLSLPAPVVGMRFKVYLTVAQDVDINPANGTQILVLTNATGDAISSAATIGNSIELVALSATTWGAFSTSGTWSDAN
jgi:hypothetical protein